MSFMSSPQPHDSKSPKPRKAERVQLKHVLIDVDFFDKPTVRALAFKHSQLAALLYVRWLMLMSRATNASVTRDAMGAIAREVLQGVGTSVATFETVLKYCLDTEMLEELSPGVFTNDRVIKDQESCAVKRKEAQDRQKKFREKKGGVTNALPTRLPVTDTDTVSVIESNLKEGELEGKPPDGLEQFSEPDLLTPLEQQAEAHLETATAAIKNTSGYMSVGRRPLKKFPRLWFTRSELAGTIEIYQQEGIPTNWYKRAFEAADLQAVQEIARGKTPDLLPAAKWCQTFVLKTMLENLKASNDHKRSGIYLENAKT